MLHFLAQLGKAPWVPYVVPAIGAVAIQGYTFVQLHCHDLIIKVLAAQRSPGEMDDCSLKLKEIISRVCKDVTGTYGNSIPSWDPTEPLFKFTPSVRFFLSSSADPIVFGSSFYKKGALIGLPFSYNLEKVEDIPPRAYQFRRLRYLKRIFRGAPEGGSEGVSVIDLGDPLAKNQVAQEIKQQYSESLILSEKAKMFAIARSMYFGDSYRLHLEFLILFTGFMCGVFVNRFSVNRLKLTRKSFSARLPCKMAGVFAAYYFYVLFGDLLNRAHESNSDDRALDLGATYQEGAVELYSKRIAQNIALRNIDPDYSNMFDDEGEFRQGLIRNKHVRLEERLAKAKERLATTKSPPDS